MKRGEPRDQGTCGARGVKPGVVFDSTPPARMIRAVVFASAVRSSACKDVLLVIEGIPADAQQQAAANRCRPAPAAPSAPPADLEAVVRRLEHELIACQRLSVLGTLAAMMAHEFNNLLTPVIARTEVALKGADAAFVQKTLARTLAQCQRAVRVARQLLELSHDAPRPVEGCAVADAVHEAIETLTRPLAKDGIEVRVEVPAALRVVAREDLFCQVLLNLVLNARAAMLERPGVLRVTATSEDTLVVIRVCDEGKGLSADWINGVLNPFLAADPTRSANDWHKVGLGLSVCRLIAHQHGATLRARRNDQAGCTFELRWPRAS